MSQQPSAELACALGIKVLLVEDEFLIRMTLAEVLRDEGYIVLEAGSGDEAIAVLRSEPGIRLLLTDLQLPGSLDGRELVAEARQQTPDLPVIYMTGRAEAVTALSPLDVVVAKPYLPSTITEAARRLTGLPRG